jgi:hypothetical protein
MPQERRRALNESIFREVNERIASLRTVREKLEIVCECASIGCSKPLEVTIDDYEAARSDPTVFIVAPGHSDPTIEQVDIDYGDYLFVRKLGEAAEDARAANPRSPV